MIWLIALIFFSGFLTLNLFRKEKKVTEIITFSLPLGMVLHTLCSFILAYLGVYENKMIFLALCFLFLILTLLFTKTRKSLFQIQNDLREIPFYYWIVIVFFLYRLILLTSTGFVNDYNWDEMRVYQFFPKKIFLTHDLRDYFAFFQPMNHFLATMTYEFAGTSIALPRIFSVLSFVNISFAIMYFLKEKKVNRHLTAFIGILFLISSGESLLNYRTFYPVVYYALFITLGVFSLLDDYILKGKSDISWYSYFLLLGAFFARREAFYHLIPFLIILGFFLHRKKKIVWKKILIPVGIFTLFFGGWVVGEKLYHVPSTVTVTEVGGFSFFDELHDKLQVKNIGEFLNSAGTWMFGSGPYDSNYLIFGIFFFTLICLLFNWIFQKRQKKKNKDIFVETAKYILLCQILYILIVLGTTVLLFSLSEFRIAASFSRYIMMVLPLSFISLGLLLFADTKEEKIGKRKVGTIPKDPRILLIIPAYNEDKSIVNTCQTVKKYNEKHHTKYDLIVINDGSSDDTQLVCDQNNIPTIQLIQNLGIGGAVQTGYKYALENQYDIAIQYDGDGQHDVKYVQKLVEALKDGNSDVVIGSRFISDLSKFRSTRMRRIGSRILSYLIRFVTGKTITDPTSGFRAVNKNVIQHLANTYPKEFPEPESIVSLLRRGYIVKEVPVEMKERTAGVSSIGMWKAMYYMINVCLSIIITSIKKVGDC